MPAVADLDALVEQWIEPLEVLDPRLGGVGGGEVQVDFHRIVRRQCQAGVGGQRRELQERRDPADSWRVGCTMPRYRRRAAPRAQLTEVSISPVAIGVSKVRDRSA